MCIKEAWKFEAHNTNLGPTQNKTGTYKITHSKQT